MGQMMEPAELPEMKPAIMRQPEYATFGSEGREKRILTSIYLDPPEQEVTNFRIERRWQEIKANEVQYKEYYLDDAEFVIIGFGTAGRISLSAVRAARENGIKVGLLRPVTLAPFPNQILEDLTEKVKAFLVVEMNSGQMLEDVRLIVRGRKPVEFFGRMGGVVPFPDEVLTEVERLVKGPLTTEGHPRDRWLSRLRTTIG